MKPEQLIDRLGNESDDAVMDKEAVTVNNTCMNQKTTITRAQSKGDHKEIPSNVQWKKKRALRDETLSVEDQSILAALENRPKNLRDLEHITKISRTLLRSRLLYLELEDLVISRGGSYSLKGL